MSNNKYIKDHRYSLEYYWGLISLFSGLIMLTILPAYFRLIFLYPDNHIFVIPAGLLFILTIISWCQVPGAFQYKGISIGCGLIFYSLFQLLFVIKDFQLYNFVLYIIAIILGISIIFSNYDINTKSIKKEINQTQLLFISLISLIFTIAILIRHFVL